MDTPIDSGITTLFGHIPNSGKAPCLKTNISFCILGPSLMGSIKKFSFIRNFTHQNGGCGGSLCGMSRNECGERGFWPKLRKIFVDKSLYISRGAD